MPRVLPLLLLLSWVSFAGSQEPTGSAETDTATEAGEAGTAAEAAADASDTDGVEDSDLDEQTYDTEDDDFVPTEEIPVGEPIPFPTDI